VNTNTEHVEAPVSDTEPSVADTIGAPVLELVDVVKTYRGSPPVHALDGVSLHVADRELVAIVGPSGSGKSTLLNVIGTLDRPTRGRMSVESIDVTSMSDAALAGLRAARLGFVFQQFHLLEGADAVDNVAAGLVYRGRPRRGRRALAVEALRKVGLGHRLHHRPPQLSGGERQRVAIARAIVGEPAFVLADEPTGNLDSASAAAIVDLLFELHELGSTIVVVTHDRDLAERFPRRISMRDGRIDESAA
jgi:putative ABC transport system ATP-binding protein